MGNPFNNNTFQFEAEAADAGSTDVNADDDLHSSPAEKVSTPKTINIDTVEELGDALENAIFDAQDALSNDAECFPTTITIGDEVFEGYKGGKCTLTWLDISDSSIEFQITIDGGYLTEGLEVRLTDPTDSVVSIVTRCRLEGCDINSAGQPKTKIKLSPVFAVVPEGGVKFQMQASGETDDLLLRSIEGTGKMIIYKKEGDDWKQWHQLDMPGEFSNQEIQAILDLAEETLTEPVHSQVTYDTSDATSLGGDASLADGDSESSLYSNLHNVGGTKIGPASGDFHRRQTGCEAGPKSDADVQPLSSVPLLAAIAVVGFYRLMRGGVNQIRRQISAHVKKTS